MKLNAAERHCIYLSMQVAVSLREDRIINIKGFIAQLVEMNNYLALMTCLKEVEGAPAVLE